MVALMDGELQYTDRSFCVLELYAAVAGDAQLVCELKGGMRTYVEHALAKKPVNCAAAVTRNTKDKQQVDEFISSSVGFEKMDMIVTKAILQSATSWIGNSCELCCLGQCVRLCLPWWFCLSCKRPIYRAVGSKSVEYFALCCCCCAFCW